MSSHFPHQQHPLELSMGISADYQHAVRRKCWLRLGRNKVEVVRLKVEVGWE